MERERARNAIKHLFINGLWEESTRDPASNTWPALKKKYPTPRHLQRDPGSHEKMTLAGFQHRLEGTFLKVAAAPCNDAAPTWATRNVTCRRRVLNERLADTLPLPPTTLNAPVRRAGSRKNRSQRAACCEE